MLLKKLGIAFAAVLALGVTMVAMASAADPLFLFGGQTGTISQVGKGKLSTLNNPFSIECSKASGEVKAANDSATFTGEVKFKECSSTGLGEPSGQISFKFKGLTCLTGTATELKPCVYIEAEKGVHIEVPLLGLVEFLAGSSQAAKITPDGTSVTALKIELATNGTNGDPALTSVSDLEKTLKPSINVSENHNATENMGAIAATLEVTFTNAGTLDG